MFMTGLRQVLGRGFRQDSLIHGLNCPKLSSVLNLPTLLAASYILFYYILGFVFVSGCPRYWEIQPCFEFDSESAQQCGPVDQTRKRTKLGPCTGQSVGQEHSRRTSTY